MCVHQVPESYFRVISANQAPNSRSVARILFVSPACRGISLALPFAGSIPCAEFYDHCIRPENPSFLDTNGPKMISEVVAHVLSKLS